MKLLTAYDTVLNLPTAGVTWSYPGNEITPLEARVPYGPINAVLGAFYNRDTGPMPVPGEHPYFHVVYDEFGRQAGLILADLGDNVELDDEAVKLNLFTQEIEKNRQFPLPAPWQSRDWHNEMFWEADEYGLAGIRWQPPEGQAFPANCLNRIFSWFYSENVQPLLYPVYNPRFSAEQVPQVGILVSPKREESGTAEELADWALQDLRHLMTDPNTSNVPWGQREFDHA